MFQEGASPARPVIRVRKVPYKFTFHFTTRDGKARSMMVEDWEIGALFWRCIRSACGDEAQACEKVRAKLLNLATTTDLHFIVGTTLAHHMQAPNPFVIIGLFYPPIDNQLDLF